MTKDEFKKVAFMELARLDTLAVLDAMNGTPNLIKQGTDELLRLMKAREVFGEMTLFEMWDVDRRLSGSAQGRPTKDDLHKILTDPAWAAVSDVERLKTLWRECQPEKQVPLEFLTDIAAECRNVDRSVIVSRRNRPKSRRTEYP